ncbi:MarR family transcriptional regulator [Aliikangiella marina]|uniref:MarR family transcriptional regulator n=1 Tax=Aliikangiella marina TaxID=1712262 RepID=A0A545TE94_9GAMM|nr:winged helix DNA-binding protein [Aliikangiella marina]TQV75543.1 MarR family transcriptional regulator [Aliikangiella marina]
MKSYRQTRKRKNAFSLTEKLEQPIDLYDHLPFQVAVVSNLLQLNRDFSIRQIIDLDPRELRVILNIGSYMPISSADIAYQARLDAYTVSRAVKTLKSLEMIEVFSRSDNKKVKLLRLTEKGHEVYQKLVDEINQRTEFLESVITQEEKALLMETLAKIEDRAEKMLTEHATGALKKGINLPADQKEIIRWHKKSNH